MKEEIFGEIPGLLPFTIDDEITKKDLKYCSDSLKELSLLSTRVFRALWIDADQNTEATETVTSFLRRIIELLDACSILVEVGAVMPASIQVRALLEVILGLEYLLEKDSKRRSMCYLVTEQYKRRKIFQEVSSLGIDIHNCQAEINRIDTEILSHPELAEANNEYIRLSTHKKKGPLFHSPNWYNLFSDIDKLRKLAIHLKREDWYILVYNTGSNVNHGNDLITENITDLDGELAFIQIRNPTYASFVTKGAFDLGQAILTSLVNKRLAVHHQQAFWSHLWDLRFKYKKVTAPHLTVK